MLCDKLFARTDYFGGQRGYIWALPQRLINTSFTLKLIAHII